MKQVAWDWKTLLPVAILVVFSLTTLLSVNEIYFRSQLVFVLVGITIYVLFNLIDYRIFKHLSNEIYFVSLVLLIVLFFLGTEARGATRWLEIAGLRVQFSEILKPFLLLSLSSWLADHQESRSLKLFVTTLALTFLTALLVFLQPDLGNAIIYIAVSVLLLFYFGFPLRFFLTTGVLAVLNLPIFWFLLRDYQRERIISFLNPQADPLGTSYNIIQAMIAVGSGQLLGRGLGLGTQSQLEFLPERHTDFIFATLSEELGFAGSLTLVLVFGFFLYRILIISQDANDNFGRFFAVGAFCLLLYQGFMNIGMNLGLIPIAGVTLPFISYGGSSLISNFIILGILASIARARKEKEVLEIR